MIWTGGPIRDITSTATSALEVECGILPLSLRREGLNLKYATKLIQQPSNPANNILLDAWQNHFTKPNLNVESFFQKMNPTLLSLNIIRIHDTVDHAGWKLVPCVVDTSLRKQINKKTDTLQTQNSVAMHYINTFTDHLCIYTDGAKSINGRTSSAVSVPSHGFTWSVRLSDGASVYTAELFALCMAIQYLPKQTNTTKPIVIFSDSLCVLQSLGASGLGSNPGLLVRARQILHRQLVVHNIIKLSWIPGHAGVAGNEFVDSIAKQALNNITMTV